MSYFCSILPLRLLSTRSQGSKLRQNLFCRFDSSKVLKNDNIKFPTLRVVMKNIETGENSWKIMTRAEALDAAKKQCLDLIMVNLTSDPPVAKLENFGKLTMEKKKKEKEIKTNRKTRELKEIMIGALIDPHDLGIKVNKMREFLSLGHPVKVSLIAKSKAMKINPNILDEVTLKLLELVEKDVGVIHQPQAKLNAFRKEFIFNPKANQ